MSEPARTILGGFEVATVNRACRGGGQDRLAVRQQGTSLIVILADGAGGTGGGAAAAQAVVDGAQGWAPSAGAEDFLTGLDRRLAATGGQSTAILLALSSHGIVGASVGDSGAWIVRGDSVEDLTSAQGRKPLLGSGGALPVGFSAGPLGRGTLLVASDGLFNYARPADIVRVAVQPELDAAVAELVALVTLRSVEVPDDVAVILCRE